MNELNLPDVLGYMTGGARVNSSVVQVALGVRPAIISAGSPFEVLLLVQNACDVSADVTATLQLPKGFVAKSARVVTGVAPGETGYMRLPTAPGRDVLPGAYKIGVEIEAKPLAKPGRSRDANGGPSFAANELPAERASRLDDLRQVAFSTAKRAALGKTVLEAPVQVGGGVTGSRELNPGWVSLWTMADLNDARLLMDRFGETMRDKVLPALNVEATLEPLTARTHEVFERAGYPLQPSEALVVAKLMALILDYAAPKITGRDPLEAGIYNLEPALEGRARDLTLPYWFEGMLKAVARDERAASHPVAAITRLLYVPLLRDAIDLAFVLVERNTGEDVGTEREKADYAERLIASLSSGGGMDFTHAYMPLVLGGIIVNDRVTMREDRIVEAFRQLWSGLDERRIEADGDSPVVEITEQVIERALEAYGYRRGTI